MNCSFAFYLGQMVCDKSEVNVFTMQCTQHVFLFQHHLMGYRCMDQSHHQVDFPIQTFRCNYALQWRHNGRDGVSNHQRLECLFNRLFSRRSKKTWKLRITGLCGGIRWPVNSPHKGPVTRKMLTFDDVIMEKPQATPLTWISTSFAIDRVPLTD